METWQAPVENKKEKVSKLKFWLENKHHFRIILVSVLTVAILAGSFFVILDNKAQVAASELLGVKTAITIHYNKAVVHSANVELSPKVEYELIWQDGLNASDLLIKPKARWQINSEYSLKVVDVKSIYGLDMPEVSKTIRTQKSPIIVSVVPKSTAINVPTNSEVTLGLDFPNENLISPRIFFEPAVPSHFALSIDKKSYKVNFEAPLAQSTTYKMRVYDSFIKDTASENGKLIFESTFTTIPKLTAEIVPNGSGISKATKVTVKFSLPVDRKSVEDRFSFSPNVEGVKSWLDDKTLQFAPNTSLNNGTTYTAKITAGAKNTLGGILEKDAAGSFTTLGNVTASFNLGWGSTGVGLNTPIRVYFNQEVDHASAQGRFSISPKVNGSFGWSGNTMIFSPSAQGYSTKYSVNVAAGVISINALNSVQAFSTSYATQDAPLQVVKLGFALDKQDAPLSCEVASLKMALRAKGVSVSEGTLMGFVGYNGPGSKTGDNRWGNPYKGFVGSLYGNGVSTGYGVYWEPIAAAARHYRSASAFTGGSAQTLANAINSGNAVVIWGAAGNPYRMDWKDIATGSTIYAIHGEHARTVRGFKGSISNPIGFYIADPIFGELYWSTAQLYANWGLFNNAGVIVY